MSFQLGCNYWASHAGTAMWSDWRPDVIDADFHRLAAHQVGTLRVFPLWPDFQPLTRLRGGAGLPVEYRHGERPLPDTAAGRAGLDAVMLARFAELVELADKHGLHLIVGLITGWMSGRLFVPPALEGLNVLTDPVALVWQVRFVQQFVEQFQARGAIVAWDLGNECNVMAPAPSREHAWHWTATLTNAIRAVDSSRMLISGMHGLSLPGPWAIADQGELTDLLTVHPYPIWTPYCDQDPLLTMRPLLHASAEARLYSDLGGRPCLVEEIGTMGPMVSDEAGAAAFLCASLLSAWAHGASGLLWWCAFDQEHLPHAPYDWTSVERELGLFRSDNSPKPLLAELAAFRRLLAQLPDTTLPLYRRQAVCLLSQSQDHWAVAYSSFVLAKQAGFDLRFHAYDKPIPDASLYLLPAIHGHQVLSRQRWHELLDRVRAGATLYISYDGGFLSEFEAVSGLRVTAREQRRSDTLLLQGHDLAFTVQGLVGSYRLHTELCGAEPLVRSEDGAPLFTRASYGAGQVYFLGLPLERVLAQQPGVFHKPSEAAYWQLYRLFTPAFVRDRVVAKHSCLLGLTEHYHDEATCTIVGINYSASPLQTQLDLHPEWWVDAVLYGAASSQAHQQLAIRVGACDALILRCRRRSG